MAWNGSSAATSAATNKKIAKPRKASSGAPMSGAFKGTLALILVLAIGAGAYWFTTSDEVKSKVIEKLPKRQIAEVQADTMESSEEYSNDSSNVGDEKLVLEAPKPPVQNVTTAHNNRVGRKMTLIDGTVVTNKTKVIFKRDFEKGLLVAMRPGGISGGLINMIRHKYTDEQIVQMLKEMTIPEEDDDDETRRAKEGVQKAKEEFLLALKDGMTVSEVLDEIRRRGVFESKMRSDAMRMRAEAQRSGDPELVRMSVEYSNKKLEENGVKKIRMPQNVSTDLDSEFDK